MEERRDREKEGGRYSMSEVTGRGIKVEKEGGMNVVRERGRRIQGGAKETRS